MEYFMTFFWLGVIVISLVVEAMTAGLVSVWLVPGALVSLVLSLFKVQLFVQIPIFFALYAMLDNAIELRHVSFLWCKNLAAADTVLSIPVFINNWSIPVNPLVLAMTALMVIQQRMTPMSMDPAQKKMMAMMPIVMLFFLYDLPSGLTLYWTVSNLFSILQLWLQKRRGQKSGAANTQIQGN